MIATNTRTWNRLRALIWMRLAGVSLAAWTFTFFFLMGLIGLVWDGGWHASWGRDTFFIPPHDLMYAGVTGAIVLAELITISRQQAPREPGSIQIAGFQAPLGIWVILCGGLMLVTAAPFDEWYHRTFGRDDGTGLWSPPHFFGMLGGLVACLGLLWLLRLERRPQAEADAKPGGLTGLSANDALTLLMFSYVAIIVGGLSLNFWAIRHWYRTEGTLYPLLAMLCGPAVLVMAQRVTRRAGAATVAVLIPFIVIGGVGGILKAAAYPIVVSLPVMGLPYAIVLDLMYARYGPGYRWLLIAGPLNVLIFYASEYLWAWYLNGQPWGSVAATLWVLPVAVAAGTASASLGAWLSERLEQWAVLQRSA